MASDGIDLLNMSSYTNCEHNERFVLRPLLLICVFMYFVKHFDGRVKQFVH